MMRFPVSVAFGLTALLITPSFATAQAGRDSTIARDSLSTRDSQPSRAFRQINFSGPLAVSRPVSRPPGAMDRFLSNEAGARLPAVTTAPQEGDITPACGIRVVPVDPKLTSPMPTVKVDERIDPRHVIKVPVCHPQD